MKVVQKLQVQESGTKFGKLTKNVC